MDGLAVARPAGKQAGQAAGTLVLLANNFESTEDAYTGIYKPVLQDLRATSMRGPEPSLFCKTLDLKAAVNARVHPMHTLRRKGGAATAH